MRHVVTAEPHRVVSACSMICRPGNVRDVVEIAVGVRRRLVDRRRQDTFLHGHDGECRFERAGGAEQVPGHRLGRADRHIVGVLAECRLDRLRFELFVELASRCRGR